MNLEQEAKTPPTVVRLKEPHRLQHPWIFARTVEKPATRIPPGSVVEIYDSKNKFVGRGFYNGHARIALRLLTTEPAEPVDAAFFQTRIERAVRWRRDLGLFNHSNGLRLIHAEGDGLGGLIVDLYGDTLAIEFFAAGMFRQRELIKSALFAAVPEANPSKLYWYAQPRIQKQESFDVWEVEAPPPVVIEEHGVRFQVVIGSKHKTGFFADQRDNRRLLAALSGGKSVADLCCHTGGFALYAKKLGGATSVVGVDLDDVEALPTARANAELNGVEIDFQAADIFAWLRSAAARGDTYDVVVLDPAKQTRSEDRIHEALDQYLAMNRLAMQVVKPGGILLTCSCTGRISEEQFLEAIRRAARDAGREAAIFRLSGPGPDHPFAAQVPEGRYLKAIWCRIL